MKKILKTIVAKILQWEARLVLRRFKPKIIGVTGSVGKTSTKDAIYRVLSNGGLSIRKSEKSYNSDLGVPLTILGCKSAWNDAFGWLEIMVYGLRQLISRRPYPKWLVLEIGLEYPGEIEEILSWIKFDLAVITLLPEVPVHVEFFESKEQVINEKILLAKKVPLGGQVLINADDPIALNFVSELKADVVTYGLDEKADYRASRGEIFYNNQIPSGLTFNLYHNGKESSVKIPGVIGDHQIYPILSALAVGEKLGLNMVEMIDTLSNYLPPAGRLRLLSGIKQTTILDDTYNASPAAMSAGLLALAGFKTEGRRIAVMGDMLQLGGYTVEAHKKIGYQASEICDLIVTVGLRTKFIDSALLEEGYPEKRFKHFDNSIEAGKYVQDIIKPEDVIFVKGSQSMRMEKVVEEIMVEPELKDQLLVRQEKEWQKR